MSEVGKTKNLTAIIGTSGAGKTTLCQLIARFHDVSRESVTIGGIDIRDIHYDELMKRSSIVFKDTYLFKDTIEGNIRFNNSDATDEDVRKAARKACCDEFIMNLPDGCKTMVEEGNPEELSGRPGLYRDFMDSRIEYRNYKL